MSVTVMRIGYATTHPIQVFPLRQKAQSKTPLFYAKSVGHPGDIEASVIFLRSL